MEYKLINTLSTKIIYMEDPHIEFHDMVKNGVYVEGCRERGAKEIFNTYLGPLPHRLFSQKLATKPVACSTYSCKIDCITLLYTNFT